MRFRFAPTFLALVLALAAGLALAGDSFPGFLPFSRGGAGGGGLSSGAADAAYLRLDATNDPVTGDVYFGSPAGNSHLLDGATANLWTSVLDSDATGNFAAHGVTAWNGATWDAGAILSAFGEGYPGNGYCTSVADAPGSAELWLSGDATSQSRLCGSVATGVEMGVSTSDGSTFENVLALTGTGAVVNDDGASDLDFRAEGDTLANLLMVDASQDAVTIGDAATVATGNRLLVTSSQSSTDIDTTNAVAGIRNSSTTNGNFALWTFQSMTTGGSPWGVGRIAARANAHADASINGDLILQARGGSGSTWSEPLILTGTTSRVGIGTLTPSTRLEVNGQAAAAVGSASAPSWSFVGDLNTGWYRSAADSISWSVGGTEGGVLRGTEANFYLPISADYGSAAAPSVRWSAANTTGLYGSSTAVSTTSGGVRSATFGPGGGALYDTDGTTPLLGTESSRAYARGIVPTANDTFTVGAAGLVWAQFVGGAGSTSAPTIRVGDADTGLYRSGVHTLDLVVDGDNAARFSGEFETQLLLDSAGSASTPTVAGFYDTDSGLGIFGSGIVDLISDGAVLLRVDNSGVHGATYTSGTGTGWQAPQLIAATLPTKPTCTGSSHAGTFAYFDDTDDALPAAFCVCGANSGGTYAWRLPDAAGTACPL